MPDSGVKISSLPSAAAEDIQGTDVLAGVSDDATKKFSFTNILTWIKARLSKSDVGLDNVANVLQYSASNPPPTPTKSDIGLGNVDNVQQYSATNPPPYPVTSVNGQTGDVSITIPTPVSPSSASPAMDGTADAGSSSDYARGDHVHPADTTKQATITATGVLVGDGSGGVSAVTVDSAPTDGSANLVTSGGVKAALTDLKSDLAAIHATGTTNTTGAAISSGTYFYLNGALVQAKAYIDSGAPFTSGTNYAAVTAGGLNDLKAALNNLIKSLDNSVTVNTDVVTSLKVRQHGDVVIVTGRCTGNANVTLISGLPPAYYPQAGINCYVLGTTLYLGQTVANTAFSITYII